NRPVRRGDPMRRSPRGLLGMLEVMGDEFSSRRRAPFQRDGDRQVDRYALASFEPSTHYLADPVVVDVDHVAVLGTLAAHQSTGAQHVQRDLHAGGIELTQLA